MGCLSGGVPFFHLFCASQLFCLLSKSRDARLGGARGGRAGRADLVHLGRYIAEAWSPIMCAWAACNRTGRIPGLDQAGARGPNFISDLLKDFVSRDGKPRVRLECLEAHLLGEPTHGPIDLETDEVRPQFRVRLVVSRGEIGSFLDF